MRASIQIFSRNMIQNEMLAASISSATGLSCECIDVFPPAQGGPEIGQRMVLIDWQQLDGDTRWDALGDVIGGPMQTMDTVLFNVPTGLDIERQALERGVRGIFRQNQPLKLLMRGITAVLEGELWYSRRAISERLRQNQLTQASPKRASAGKEMLSAREREVLLLIAQGLSNDEVGDKLCISLSTVKKHLCNIYAKLKISNRIQAAFWAVQNLKN
ncbi:helix-turn-helix transcriptional regulator [Desulfocurvibacter africanus]|nr:response regulator transcription factor [Desulfocurvibacter africanus]